MNSLFNYAILHTIFSKYCIDLYIYIYILIEIFIKINYL